MKTSSHRNRHASLFLSILTIAALEGFSACAKNTHVTYKVACKLSVSTYPAAHSDHVYTQALTARAGNAKCNVVSVLSEHEVKL